MAQVIWSLMLSQDSCCREIFSTLSFDFSSIRSFLFHLRNFQSRQVSVHLSDMYNICIYIYIHIYVYLPRTPICSPFILNIWLNQNSSGLLKEVRFGLVLGSRSISPPWNALSVLEDSPHYSLPKLGRKSLKCSTMNAPIVWWEPPKRLSYQPRWRPNFE